MSLDEKALALAAENGVAISTDGLAELVTRIDNMVEDDSLFQEFSRQVEAGGNPFGGLRLGGNATWAPVRDPRADWSSWGQWEAWEECRIGPVNDGTAVGAVPTGGWLVWNSANPAQVMGLPVTPTARKQAEMWAMVLNAGKRTRVVPHRAEAEASALNWAQLSSQLGAEVERLKSVVSVR